MSSFQILSYSPELQPYFESINKDWITRYFSLEPFDLELLEHPDETILAKGGAIIFAKSGDEIVGTVGLIPKDSNTCEMIKMGVLDQAKGQGIGRALCQAIIDEAKKMGFSEMVLYSNTKLLPALKLYTQLGFEEVFMKEKDYARSDIKMRRSL